MNLRKNDPEKLLRRTAFLEGLISVDPAKLKGTQVIVRHADGDFVTEGGRYNRLARELRDANVDLYFASCRPTARHLDAVNLGAKPLVVAGAFRAELFSATGWGYKEIGYISYDITMVKNWVDLFFRIPKMPDTAKIAVIGDKRNQLFENPGATAFFNNINGAVLAAKPTAKVTHVEGSLSTNSQIKTDLQGKDGVIVLGLTNNADRRDELINIVNSLKIPALYPNRFYVTSGGLISYGVKLLSLYRQAGIVAGTALTGGTPPPSLTMADSAYQEITLNLKTAIGLGFTSAEIDTLKRHANVVFTDDD